MDLFLRKLLADHLAIVIGWCVLLTIIPRTPGIVVFRVSPRRITWSLTEIKQTSRLIINVADPVLQQVALNIKLRPESPVVALIKVWGTDSD